MHRIAVIVALSFTFGLGCSKKDSSSKEPASTDNPETTAAKPAAATPAAPAAPTAAPTAPAQALPAPAELSQGESYWGVYVALADSKSADFMAAQKRAKELGVVLDMKDANCDVALEGKEAPPKAADDNRMLLASYYMGEADARAVATAFGTTVWVGQVQTMCLD